MNFKKKATEIPTPNFCLIREKQMYQNLNPMIFIKQYNIQYKTLFHSNHIKWTHEFTCTMQPITIGDKV